MYIVTKYYCDKTNMVLTRNFYLISCRMIIYVYTFYTYFSGR